MTALDPEQDTQHTQPAAEPDLAEVTAAITRRLARSPWVELRAIDPARTGVASTWVGPGGDVAAAAAWAVAQNRAGRSVYSPFNRIDACPGPTAAATDAHVSARCRILFDMDPERSPGTAATAVQRAATLRAAAAVAAFLRGHGWGDPAERVDSGSGIHLYYDCGADVPQDALKPLLTGVNAVHGEPGVKSDPVVRNLARIAKLPGTVDRKSGRLCRAIDLNAAPVTVTPDMVAAGVAALPASATFGPKADRPKPERAPKPHTRPAGGSEPEPPPPSGFAPPPGWAATYAAAAAGDVTLSGVVYPAADRLARAGRLFASVPDDDLSRSGRHGHDTFLRHLRTAANCLLVRDRASLRGLAEGYNARLDALNRERPGDGFEPWSAGEIDHKLDAALEPSADPAYPPGGKLGRPAGHADPVPQGWNDPERLARGFLRGHAVRTLKDSTFLHAGGRYAPLSDAAFKGMVRRHVQGEADAYYAATLRACEAADRTLKGQADAARAAGQEQEEARLDRDRKDNAKRKPAAAPPVLPKLVAAAAEAVRSLAQLPDDTPFDTWLGDPGRPPVLAVGNGLLDVRAGTLDPHSPDWFSLTGLDVAYIPGAVSERWVRFVERVTGGDADKAAVLQEVAGACLDPGLRVKFFALLAGGGDNGKSVFLAALRFVLGERNVAAVPLEKFGERFGTYPLLGKLANLVGDQGYVDSKDEGRLKAATGGDLIEYEAKGRNVLAGPLTAKLVFAVNQTPTLSDPTSAVWRRLVAVPFTWTCPLAEQNPALLTAGYWLDDLPGVLNWMLAGLARLHAAGRFTRSAACEALAARMRDESNPVDAFLTERYAADPTGFVAGRELREQYDAWRIANGIDKVPGRRTVPDGVARVFPGSRDTKTYRDGQQVRGYAGFRAAAVPAAGSLTPDRDTKPV
jgi:P4 family phage/plasmid primase-like protien